MLALGPLLFATPAYADPLADAQAALLAGQQEVADATQALTVANATLSSALDTVQVAQTAVDQAQANYDTNLITQTVSVGQGLSVDIYNNIISRTPEAWQLCKHIIISQIANQWGSGPVFGCNSDWVTVHYYGTITVPTTGSYRFMNIADDGFYMTINGQTVINEWRDKGCGGSWGSYIQLQAGQAYSIDAWFYENGGGACSTLYYQSPTNWTVVPASWFGQTATTTTVKDPALLAILQEKQAILASAQQDLDAAQIAQQAAQIRLDTALAAIPALEQAVYDLTPRLHAPVLVSATLTETGVDLVWTAPTDSNVSVESYAISWSTTNFTTNGWGWSHDQLSITVPLDILDQNGGLGNVFQFEIRADNNTQQIYSTQSNIIEVTTIAPVIVVPPVVEPTPIPTTTPEPIPTATPEPTPTPTVDPTPVVEPTPQPSPAPAPEPVIIPTPVPVEIPVIIEPTPEPTKEPVVEPTPTPTVSPTQEPTPTPSPSTQPTKEPTTPVVEPTPTPEPSTTPEPTKLELPVDVKSVDPKTLTDQQAAELVVAANAILATAEQGSPAYQEALQALAVAAVADDPQLPAALESIPGAAEVLATFNALGNVGADMAPQVREEAKKTVIASVIATGAAVNATVAAATSAAAMTTSSSSTGSGSSGGSSGNNKTSDSNASRRREE